MAQLAQVLKKSRGIRIPKMKIIIQSSGRAEGAVVSTYSTDVESRTVTN